MKRSIKDTYVYKVLDLESTVKSCGEINADLDKYKLNQDIVDAILNEFKFKISFPAKIRIIEEIKAGKITFVDTPLVANLPTWLISRDGVSIQTAVVNLFGKIKVKEDGTAQFNAREIFALSIIALTVKEFYLKEAKILYNMQISKLAVVIYERIMYRVLDTLYSLDVGPEFLRNDVRIQLRMFAASFLLEKKLVSASDYDSIYNFIIKDLAHGVSPEMVMKKIMGAVEGNPEMLDTYKDFPSFIAYLQKIHPILKDLDITTFLRKFIMMYGEKALLMIENYHYFLAYVFSVTLGGNILKDFALETPVGKEGIQLYNLYMDMIK